MWKVFNLTLDGKALEWYIHLGSYGRNTYTSWENLRRTFINKYFPEANTLATKKEISAIKQREGETLLDYRTRFQDLLFQCPNHQHCEESLVEYFYTGLLLDEADHIDAYANGSITNLDVEATWELIKDVTYKRKIRWRHTRAVKGIVALDFDQVMEKMASNMDGLTIAIEELATRLASSPQPRVVAI